MSNLAILGLIVATAVLYCGAMNVLSGKRFFQDSRLYRTIQYFRGKGPIPD